MSAGEAKPLLRKVENLVYPEQYLWTAMLPSLGMKDLARFLYTLCADIFCQLAHHKLALVCQSAILLVS